MRGDIPAIDDEDAHLLAERLAPRGGEGADLHDLVLEVGHEDVLDVSAGSDRVGPVIGRATERADVGDARGDRGQQLEARRDRHLGEGGRVGGGGVNEGLGRGGKNILEHVQNTLQYSVFLPPS